MEERGESNHPIDLIDIEPIAGLNKIFDAIDLDYALDQMQYWLYMALSSDKSIYNSVNHRAEFIEFYDDLLILIEVMYFFHMEVNIEKKNRLNPGRVISIHDETAVRLNTRRRLSLENATHPMSEMILICSVYEIPFIRLHLWHFLESVALYEGVFMDSIKKEEIFTFYLYLVTLVESAYNIVNSNHKDKS